jgi:hypothetical protein
MLNLEEYTKWSGLLTDFLNGLFLDPKGGSTIFMNVDGLLLDPRR